MRLHQTTDRGHVAPPPFARCRQKAVQQVAATEKSLFALMAKQGPLIDEAASEPDFWRAPFAVPVYRKLVDLQLRMARLLVRRNDGRSLRLPRDFCAQWKRSLSDYPYHWLDHPVTRSQIYVCAGCIVYRSPLPKKGFSYASLWESNAVNTFFTVA